MNINPLAYNLQYFVPVSIVVISNYPRSSENVNNLYKFKIVLPFYWLLSGDIRFFGDLRTPTKNTMSANLNVPLILPIVYVESDSDSDTGSGSLTPILLRGLHPALLHPVVQPAGGVRRRHSWMCG